jgi:hypothetical protein
VAATNISDKVFRFLAAMASWVFGLSGAAALGPALIALLVVADEALKSAGARSGSLRLAMSMSYQLFTIFAVYWSGAVCGRFPEAVLRNENALV